MCYEYHDLCHSWMYWTNGPDDIANCMYTSNDLEISFPIPNQRSYIRANCALLISYMNANILIMVTIKDKSLPMIGLKYGEFGSVCQSIIAKNNS